MGVLPSILLSLTLTVTPLTEGQREQLCVGVLSAADYREPAFDALLANTATWSADDEPAAPQPVTTFDPRIYSSMTPGALVRVEGVIARIETLPPDYRDVQRWLVIPVDHGNVETASPAVLFVNRRPEGEHTANISVGDRITIEARFYKVMRLLVSGEASDCTAFVGALPRISPSPIVALLSPRGIVILATLLVAIILITLRVSLRCRTAPRGRTPVGADTMDLAEPMDLPEEPAEALKTLARHAEKPP
ncbi:MAG: hypothetical protein KAS72_11450 [Phycisphaerales bacterium]|nr:hypothetical protein [Phycisphaerales bacterium]